MKLRRIKVIAGSLIFAVVSIIPATFASATGEKVTICHATSSQKNPYVRISVSHSAVDGQKKNDHSHHSGDIIPPVAGVNDGQNWDDKGRAIYNNDCKVPQTTETTVVVVDGEPPHNTVVITKDPVVVERADAAEPTKTAEKTLPYTG